MKTVRTMAGTLAAITVFWCVAGPGPTQAEEGKRGFKPGRLIGKLIPGGKDRDEETATVIPADSEAAVVIPNPENPAAPVAPAMPPVVSGNSGASAERIPPPPLPGTVTTSTFQPSATNRPAPVPEPSANPFPEPEKERGLLGGVAGMVGKVIPGGRDSESATVEAPPTMETGDDERGFLDRFRGRRKESARAENPNIIPPPTIIPRPTENPAIAPPPSTAATASSQPVERLSIPLTRSLNPGAPVQREERRAEVESPVEASNPISPTMPPSNSSPLSTETQAAVGRAAMRFGATDPAFQGPGEPPSAPQQTSVDISPSVPASNLTPVPDTARAAIDDSAVGPNVAPAVAPMASERERLLTDPRAIPPPSVPAPAPTPESDAVAPEPAPRGLVISDGSRPSVSEPDAPTPEPISTPDLTSTDSPSAASSTSAVAALTGEPATPPAPVASPAPAPSTLAPSGDAPPVSGGTHFVVVRDGVNGSVTGVSGGSAAVPAGTVMRYLDGNEKIIEVQLPNGARATIEAWQVRDATFDEAVEYLKTSG